MSAAGEGLAQADHAGRGHHTAGSGARELLRRHACCPSYTPDTVLRGVLPSFRELVPREAQTSIKQ